MFGRNQLSAIKAMSTLLLRKSHCRCWTALFLAKLVGSRKNIVGIFTNGWCRSEFLTSSWIPIHSVTAGVVDARCLTVLNTARWIRLTPKNVSVLFNSPATYEKCVKVRHSRMCCKVLPNDRPRFFTDTRILWQNVKIITATVLGQSRGGYNF